MSTVPGITDVIRVASPLDLDALVAMGRRFVKESSYPLTYDPELARETFWYAIHREILIVHDVGVLVGGILGTVEKDFCKEGIAYVSKLFVDKEFRGLGTSRRLLALFESEAKNRGARLIFASGNAGMGERVGRLYVRLFEKAGFKVTGRVLTKEV